MIGKWSLPQQSSCTSHEKRSKIEGLAKDRSMAEYEPFPECRKVYEHHIVASLRGMHVSPVKHSYASVTDRQTDGQTDRRRTKGS